MLRKKSPSDRVGLIAGQGELPVLFAQAGRSLNKKIVVFGVEGCTDARLKDLADEVHYVGLGDLEKLSALLKSSGVRQVALAGGVSKKDYYNSDFRIDNEAKKLLQNTKNRGDDHLLRAFGLFLKVKCGVSILDPRVFLKDTTATKGVLTRRQPTAEEREDLKLGWKIAKAIGKMDIGQTVVVKRGMVLAVEAIEGTDAAIKRGGALGQGEVVVIKVSKPNQNLRFDLPTIGCGTLENMKALSSRVLGIEAGRTIMIFKDKLIEKADQENMTLVGMN